MNTPHLLPISMATAALFATMLGIAVPAVAHHCKGAHAGAPGCDGGGGDGGGDSGDTSTETIPLVCSFSEGAGDHFLGDGLGDYSHGIDGVTCTTGNTHKNSRTSRIRWYGFGGGNIRRAVRKMDVVLDESSCTNAAGCAVAPEAIFTSAGGVVEDMEDGRLFVEAYAGTDGLEFPHIQELTPDATYSVRMDFWLMGETERWVLQFMSEEQNCDRTIAVDVRSEDATLYTWPDGDADGRPDGYTLTSATALNTSTLPPTVDPGNQATRTATLCSNVGIDGSECGPGGQLCHVISQMEVQFTWHAVIQ